MLHKALTGDMFNNEPAMLSCYLPTNMRVIWKSVSLMAVGFHIFGLTYSNDLLVSKNVSEHLGQVNNESFNTNVIGKGTLTDDHDNVGKTDGKVTSGGVSNNNSEIVLQAVSYNETDSFNVTNSDKDTWKFDTSKSPLEKHLREYLFNMTDGSFDKANESHLALAINATTDMYTDEFLATLTNEIMNKHLLDQMHRIDDVCQSEYFYACFL